MKRLLTILLILTLSLCSCGKADDTDTSTTPVKVGRNELRGVWISCYEMDFARLDEAGFRQNISEKFSKIADFGLNTVFIHMRANSDAFYPSKYFPWAKQISPDGTAPSYDPLKIIIEIADEKNLQIHAWINPYRVSAASDDISALNDKCPAKIWLSDDDPTNDDFAVAANGGIYYNPAIEQVQKLIVNGVRELAENYELDGIHFDDYFYPTTDQDFDKSAYDRYCSQAEAPLDLDDWRRANVTALVKSVYNVCRQNGKLFGISPAADISSDGSDRNYRELYADITRWMANDGYIDYIAPQLYFGFDYPSDEFKFDALLDKWTALEKNENVKMYIGLAAYKIGKEDAGSNEWINSNDILNRQCILMKEVGCDGFIIFSYSSFVNVDPLFKAQMDNLKTGFSGF